jgi:nicotinate-nucleotide adenylyltransferase
LGLDAFESLPRWYRYQEVVPQCQWLVVPRATKTAAPAADLQKRAIAVVETLQQSGLAVDWRWVPMPQIAVSSSLIRRYCGDRRSIRYLVPDAVRTYIEQHDLYGSSTLGDELG